MEQIQRVLDLLDELQQKFDSLVDRINGVLSHVPFFLQWAADRFMDMWDGVVNAWQGLWDQINEFVSYLGSPPTIEDRRESWEDLGRTVTERAVEADASQSEVDFSFRGRAADRYAASLTPQRRAIEAVQNNLTSRIGPALDGVSNALYIFYAGVIAALVVLIGGILTATGEAVTVLGLPLVPPTALAAIGVAVTAIAATVVNLRSAASGAASTFSDIATESAEFGADGWPAAVI